MLLKVPRKVEDVVSSGGFGHGVVDLRRLIDMFLFKFRTVQAKLPPEKSSLSLLLCKLLHNILLVGASVNPF